MNELPLIGLLKAPEAVREDVLRTFGDSEEAAVRFAVTWAWHNRRVREMSQARAAELVGIATSHFSNILAGKKNLPPHKINAYEAVVGNRALTLTLERFRAIRERELVSGLSRAIAENMVRSA